MIAVVEERWASPPRSRSFERVGERAEKTRVLTEGMKTRLTVGVADLPAKAQAERRRQSFQAARHVEFVAGSDLPTQGQWSHAGAQKAHPPLH